MDEMRILTVRQPWALHIIQSGKDVENRPRNIAGNYRGPVAIHAALKEDYEALRDLPRLPPNGIPRFFRYGKIIGVVDLIGAHRANGSNPGELNLCARHGLCSEWAQKDCWHLELANPRPLKNPIPFTGALGLRRLDDGTRIRVESELS